MSEYECWLANKRNSPPPPSGWTIIILSVLVVIGYIVICWFLSR